MLNKTKNDKNKPNTNKDMTAESMTLNIPTKYNTQLRCEN